MKFDPALENDRHFFSGGGEGTLETALTVYICEQCPKEQDQTT